MKKALSQSYNRLNTNGILYIDLIYEDKIRKNDVVEHKIVYENYSQK